MGISSPNFIYLALQGFWVLGLVGAWLIKMATVQQMQANGVKVGMPYLWHLGMWNDVLTVHPWCALMVGLYGAQWSHSPWGLPVVVLSLVISWYANWAWTRHTDIIEAHGRDGHMSIVGIIHIPHMAIIVTIALMSLLWAVKGEVPGKLLVGSVCLLLAHACVGQHGVLRQLNPSWNPWPQQSVDATVLVLNAVFLAGAFYFLFSYFADRAA